MIRRISWRSFGLGGLLGAGVTGCLLLFIEVGEDSAVADQNPSEALSAPRKAGPRGAGSSAGPRDWEKPSREKHLVHWLSDKLRAAYEEEALPEIIGGEAGRIAGEQTRDYVFESYDPEEIDAELAEMFSEIPELEYPWEVGHYAWDCKEAPCVLRVDLTAVDASDPRGCQAILEGLLEELGRGASTVPLSTLSIGSRRGGCGIRGVVHTPQSGRRRSDIDAGVEGWLEVMEPRKSEVDPIPSDSP